jgi:hypothetical protein
MALCTRSRRAICWGGERAVTQGQKLRRERTEPRDLQSLVAEIARRDHDTVGGNGRQGLAVPQAVENPVIVRVEADNAVRE